MAKESKFKQKSSEILSSFNEHLPSVEPNEFQINLMPSITSTPTACWWLT